MTNGEAICESESAYIYCFKRKNSNLAFSINLGLTIQLCGRILVGRLSANMSLMGGIPLIPDQVLGTNRSITSEERKRFMSSGCDLRKLEEHCVVIKSLYSCRWNSYVFSKRSNCGPWLVGNGNNSSSGNSSLSIPFQMSSEVPIAIAGEPMGPGC